MFQVWTVYIYDRQFGLDSEIVLTRRSGFRFSGEKFMYCVVVEFISVCKLKFHS